MLIDQEVCVVLAVKGGVATGAQRADIVELASRVSASSKSGTSTDAHGRLNAAITVDSVGVERLLIGSVDIPWHSY